MKRSATKIPMARTGTEVEVAKAIIHLSSEQCLKMTGQIVKVDGGKSITSKGQIDWYGMSYTNRKFEPEASASYANYLMRPSDKPRPVGNKRELADWVDDMQTSSWAIQSDDAHKKALSMYVNQEENLSHLKYAAEAHKDGAVYNPK